MTNGPTRHVQARRLVEMITGIVMGGALGADTRVVIVRKSRTPQMPTPVALMASTPARVSLPTSIW